MGLGLQVQGPLFKGPALNPRNPLRFRDIGLENQGLELTEVSDYPQDVLCRGIAARTIRGIGVFRLWGLPEFRALGVLSFGGCESLEPEALNPRPTALHQGESQAGRP